MEDAGDGLGYVEEASLWGSVLAIGFVPGLDKPNLRMAIDTLSTPSPEPRNGSVRSPNTVTAKPHSLGRQRDILRALPGQLFYSTLIPVCLWLLVKNKNADAKRGFRARRKEMLFISHTSAPALDQQTGIINLWHN